MMKIISAIMMCIVCFAGTVMASGMDDETLLVAEPRMAVARDEVYDVNRAVLDRTIKTDRTQMTFSIRFSDVGIYMSSNGFLTYKDIAEAWQKNRHYVYMALAATSVTLLFNGRLIKYS